MLGPDTVEAVPLYAQPREANLLYGGRRRLDPPRLLRPADHKRGKGERWFRLVGLVIV